MAAGSTIESTSPHARPADLLRWPVIGPLLRWRHARTSIQILFLAIAAVLVLDGLFGRQIAPANAATVVTWVHYRGLLVIGLLAAGNLFCTGCPFVLVRDAGRRLQRPRFHWPRRLRTKWAGVLLFAGVLFVYELFDLWALPRGTALLVLGYFAAAVVVDLLFAGATFCKYLCPIGQFNFIASTVSPLELQVRNAGTCGTCRTYDCIRGNRSTHQRGCELGLFLPSKVGNLDCTFCLDCVQACPHDNVALAPRVPGLELLDSRRRSGIGRLTARPDLAALAVLFAFGGLLNAFAMTSPVFALETWLAGVTNSTSETLPLALLFLGVLGAAPLLLLGAAALATQRLARTLPESIARTAVRYAFALVPFGLGMWLAHYGFHFLTGALTIVPVVQSTAISVLGWPALGAPLWHWTGMRPGAVFPIQLGFILLGTFGSMTLAHLISERDHPDRSVPATVPWVLVVLTLATAAVWVLWQPMEMRGVGFAG
jgi:ferredoxin